MYIKITIRKYVTIEQGIEKIYLLGEASVRDVSGRGNVLRGCVCQGSVLRGCVRRGNVRRGTVRTPFLNSDFTNSAEDEILSKIHT